MSPSKAVVYLICAIPLWAQQTVEVAKVISRSVECVVRLPGELLPYESVDLHARVTGFVDRVEVDRGSVVRTGQLLVTLVAPELAARRAEAEAKAQAVASHASHRPAIWWRSTGDFDPETRSCGAAPTRSGRALRCEDQALGL